MVNKEIERVEFMRDLRSLYQEALTSYKEETPEEIQEVLRNNWTALLETMVEEEEISLVKVGGLAALMPVLGQMETASPEKVKEFAYALFFSLLSEEAHPGAMSETKEDFPTYEDELTAGEEEDEFLDDEFLDDTSGSSLPRLF